ncbi:MAG: hypothetical protein HOP23_04775 [Methylococcaceae bacterium]|nr:hypothetical protein [Methylococcaceae bacterium]
MLKQIKDSSRLTQFKTRYPNANAIIIVFAIVMVWRGAWGLLDTYFFPGSPTFSFLSCIAIGALILYLDDFRIENLKR